MPFTFSHPAIVLPLKKVFGKTLSLTGLVMGSIIPDFEYFIRMKVQSIYSHTLLGLIWFDLPLGLILTFVYHLIVRNDLINNLPEILNRKLSAFKYFDWLAYFKRNWIIVFISILIGAATHLFWDDFTHPNGYFVTKIIWLSKEVTLSNIKVPVFTIIQHLSTLIGGTIVIWAIFNLKGERLDQSHKKVKYWIWVVSIMILISIIRIFTAHNQLQFGNIIVMLISAFLIGVIVIPFLKRIFKKSSPPVETR